MQLQSAWLPLLVCATLLLSFAESRRVRVQPLPREPIEEETIQYYAAAADEDPQQEEQQQVVLVSSAGHYNGLYGQPTSRTPQDNYISPSPRKHSAALQHSQHHNSRSKEALNKPPPVQTIRNYNKVNDDGSFTFGYEAADGSFKEETRGTDCVVRGKYGYVDPDGNKREFTYVSGNPCDPNAPKDDDQDETNETENGSQDNAGPANYPIARPVLQRGRPSVVTVAPKPAVTLFQSSYDQGDDGGEEVQIEPEQVLKPSQPIRRPQYITRPQYIQQTASEEAQVYSRRPQLIHPATTPSSILYRNTINPVSITPRPSLSHVASPTPSSARTQLPATTYRPQLLQLSVTPRPTSLLYTKQAIGPAAVSTVKPSVTGNLDFDAEFQKFQQENSIVSNTPQPVVKEASVRLKPHQLQQQQNQGQIYSSALIFDPASGQYNTQLYQTLPQTEGDFTLNQRIQPYVHQPQPRPQYNLAQLQRQSPLYQNLRPQQTQQVQPQNPQAAYQQQQAELQFQNSAQLFAQQQRVRQQQQSQQNHQQQAQQQPQARPQYYYIQPQADQSQGLASGQIDSFLRGHNIQF